MAYASINNQQIYFEDSGGKGIPIIMMHGFLMDQSLFDHQVKFLSPTYRCVRFDARGFGKTKWDERAFTLYDTVADCVALMDFLKIENAVVVGMSQGGYAALRLALKHRDRVKALVLMSTQAGIDSEETKKQYIEMRDTWVNHGPVQPLIHGLATTLLGPQEKIGMDAVWNEWIPKWKTIPKNAIFHAMNNLLTRDDISNELHKIITPALVTHGDNDIGMPIIHGKALSTLLTDCKNFVTVKGAAHAANFTHPATINEAMIDFLEYINLEKIPAMSFACSAP